ncbi:hypothetical protein GCM10020229_30070 [Kitasatospora albolonga]
MAPTAIINMQMSALNRRPKRAIFIPQESDESAFVLCQIQWCLPWSHGGNETRGHDHALSQRRHVGRRVLAGARSKPNLIYRQTGVIPKNSPWNSKMTMHGQYPPVYLTGSIRTGG